eukprot:gene44190-55769_t
MAPAIGFPEVSFRGPPRGAARGNAPARAPIVRTACATAVATDALARDDATTLGIFGTGALAAAHIAALPLVRPIERVLVRGRDPERTRGFVEAIAKRSGIHVRSVEDPRDAAACDIVCTLTGAREPVLF